MLIAATPTVLESEMSSSPHAGVRSDVWLHLATTRTSRNGSETFEIGVVLNGNARPAGTTDRLFRSRIIILPHVKRCMPHRASRGCEGGVSRV